VKDKKRASIWEPGVFILGTLMAMLSAIICMQIMGQLGIAPNTSLIGAVLVMGLARVPLMVLRRFKNPERQNYVLSFASAAGFTAANCGFVAVATVFILGRTDLILPISVGIMAGCMVSVVVMGLIFNSKIFPADGAWPMGQVVATTIQAGDEGGRKGIELFQGLAVGVLTSLLGIPAAGIGIAFVANMMTMAAVGIGMVLRAYVVTNTNIAQGIMIGAGMVALVQIFHMMIKKSTSIQETATHTVSDKHTKNVLMGSSVVFTAGAVLLAFVSGIFTDMGLFMSLVWLVFAGFTAVIILVLVGTASMHSGWAPAFAVVTICLTLGLVIGFPPIPLAVLVGYLGAVGMPLADTGIGLKSGWIIRGKGENEAHEKSGRKQQVIIKLFGVLVGVAMSLFFGVMLINNEVVPPMSLFYATKVTEAINPTLLRELALWAIPGAVLQAAFGNKSVGLMLATGLLINNAAFGITLLVSITIRRIFGEKHMGIRAPGLIAGDGLFGFGVNLFRTFL